MNKPWVFIWALSVHPKILGFLDQVPTLLYIFFELEYVACFGLRA